MTVVTAHNTETRRRHRRRVVAIDFFSGAGGLSAGLVSAGIKVLAGVDNDPMLRATYDANHGDGSFIEEDITTTDIHELRQRVGIRSTDVVIYAACTPCQPFSTLSQRRGVDARKELLLAFGQLVRQSPPDYVIVENVPGLQNAYGREIHLEFLEDLKAAGLTHWSGKMIDASDYGVPQVRKRYVLVASAHGEIDLPKPMRGPKKTVRETIGSFPTAVPYGHAPELPGHVFRAPKEHHRKILEAIPIDGGSRSDVVDTSILLKCHQDRPNVHKDVFGRMSWDSPSPTLTCRCTDVYCGRFAHPEENRGLSLREAASLQTFPSDYVFKGTLFHAAKQIGNAVPVELARRIGLTLRRHVKEHNLTWVAK